MWWRSCPDCSKISIIAKYLLHKNWHYSKIFVAQKNWHNSKISVEHKTGVGTITALVKEENHPAFPNLNFFLLHFFVCWKTYFRILDSFYIFRACGLGPPCFLFSCWPPWSSSWCPVPLLLNRWCMYLYFYMYLCLCLYFVGPLGPHPYAQQVINICLYLSAFFSCPKTAL